MNPQLLAALLSFSPALFSKLFGGDPQKKYRQQVQKLTSAQNVGNETNKFYNQGLASPMYSQAQGAIAAGANQASNQVAGNLAQRGIGTTGTAAVLSGLTPSLVGSQQAGLRSSTYQGAQNQAQQSIQAQLAALNGSQGPSQTQQLFSGGLEAFLPYLQQLLSGRALGGGANTPWNAVANANQLNPLPGRSGSAYGSP
jgi:hypothetical protein